jgi:hypothetical protein
MTEENISLEAFSSLLQGITYILARSDTTWIPYEFLPSTVQTKMLLCGSNKSPIFLTDWKYILQNPGMADWSVICSIIKHLPAPAVLFITHEIGVPPQALAFFQKVAPSIGCSIIIERTEAQLATINFQAMDAMFFPVIPVQQIQSMTIVFQQIMRGLPAMKVIDATSLLQQVAPLKLGLVLAKNPEGKWRIFWYRPDESKAPNEGLLKGQIASWLRAFAALME